MKQVRPKPKQGYSRWEALEGIKEWMSEGSSPFFSIECFEEKLILKREAKLSREEIFKIALSQLGDEKIKLMLDEPQTVTGLTPEKLEDQRKCHFIVEEAKQRGLL